MLAPLVLAVRGFTGVFGCRANAKHIGFERVRVNGSTEDNPQRNYYCRFFFLRRCFFRVAASIFARPSSFVAHPR